MNMQLPTTGFTLIALGGLFGWSLAPNSSDAQAGGGSRKVGAADLRSLLEPLRQKYDLPALAGAIVTSRGVVAIGAVGVRKYGNKTPVTIDDQFHLGSDTKAMTATLIALLVEEGKLSWDTRLAQVFPDLADSARPAYLGVTIEQLLAHRAGFTDMSWPQSKSLADMQRLPGTAREQRQAYVALILREPLLAEPGAMFLYSNRSYAVAGAIAERVTDDSWEHLMEERLFKPLGMTTWGFGAMGQSGNIDEPWQHMMSGKRHKPIEPGPLADNPAVISPAGAVHCSIGDWAKFIQAHLRGEQGEPGLLTPETYRRLHTAPFGGEYGYGWLMMDRGWGGGRVLTHAGSNTQNFAAAWVAPLKDFAVLVATNQGGEVAAKACDETAATLIGFHGK